jgi:hypothetical protein
MSLEGGGLGIKAVLIERLTIEINSDIFMGFVVILLVAMTNLGSFHMIGNIKKLRFMLLLHGKNVTLAPSMGVRSTMEIQKEKNCGMENIWKAVKIIKKKFSALK